MKSGTVSALLTWLVAALPAFAQAPRTDVFWARRVPTIQVITLDGHLNEAAWAQAESMIVRYGIDSGQPGSGYKFEAGFAATDPTNATLKLLVKGNELYLGARIRDQSIGGSKDFNRFDGLLMALKNRAAAGAPKGPAEYLYSWWYEGSMDPQPPGQLPAFKGLWANEPPGSPRTPEQIAAWDAVTFVNGTSNSDATNDQYYTVEMRFDLTVMGYDVTQPQGDVVEWNVSIYDCDWFWETPLTRFSSNRVWWQSPWGNQMWYDEVHIFARPNVTTTSGPLPVVGPEFVVPNGAPLPAPTIDGQLNETVWRDIAGNQKIDIRYGDDALRSTYTGVGPWRSGQYQPPVNGGEAAILDPANATVKMFFRDNNLYLGFDVHDQVVQFHAAEDRMDGFDVTLNERVVRNPDQALQGRSLMFKVAQNGTAQPLNDLLTLVTNGGAQVALVLKPGTTVDTLGTQADTGYTAEMRVDLTRLGYPSGLGDGTLWVGVDYYDGDSFTPFTDSYGTRTWWFRERFGLCCPAWAYMDPTFLVTDAGDPDEPQIDGYSVLGTFPNPGRHSTIRYALRQQSDVVLRIFDVRGRLLDQQKLGKQAAGVREAFFQAKGFPAGVYVYRLELTDPETGALRALLPGRLTIVK